MKALLHNPILKVCNLKQRLGTEINVLVRISRRNGDAWGLKDSISLVVFGFLVLYRFFIFDHWDQEQALDDSDMLCYASRQLLRPRPVRHKTPASPHKTWKNLTSFKQGLKRRRFLAPLGCWYNRAHKRPEHQSAAQSEGSQRQSPLFRLVTWQETSGVLLSGRKADCLGRLHHKQGACCHHADNLGHGMRLWTIR